MLIKHRLTQFLGLFLFFLILFGLNRTRIFRSGRNQLERLLIVPAKEKVYWWQRFFKKDLGGCSLKNEREAAELRAKVALLTEENREQKRLLSLPLPQNWQYLMAKVIGIGEETLTISLGENDGLRIGMVAMVGETFLGRVVGLSEKMAQIRLPSYFEERLVVSLISPDKATVAKGLLIGRGQGRMRVEQIFVSEVVKQGDLVVTNVEKGNLLVGEVEEVVEAKGGVFKIAQVKRLFNPEELNTVFLIKGEL